MNFFMRSLAESHGASAIGIVFSGTGADGTLGLENIKAEGGITFAQEPSTARYDGMPRSAIDNGCVDFVLPPKSIAKEIERIRRHPYLFANEETKAERSKDLEDSAASQADPEKDLAAVLHQLRKSSGVDFSQYKPNTIHRRTLRRMVILKLDSLNKYAQYLKEHPEEANKLFDDVLIPVTSFFRDFEAFEALKTQVYPAIVKDKSRKSSIRMWAPGCSTGEETYSLAMTLLEFLGEKAPSFQVQIFGTDLNEKGLKRRVPASTGRASRRKYRPSGCHASFSRWKEISRQQSGPRHVHLRAAKPRQRSALHRWTWWPADIAHLYPAGVATEDRPHSALCFETFRVSCSRPLREPLFLSRSVLDRGQEAQNLQQETGGVQAVV